MSKSPEVELMQLKKALAYVADALDHIAARLREEAGSSGMTDIIAASIRAANDHATTLRVLVREVERLRSDAEDYDIVKVVAKAAQAAIRERSDPLDPKGRNAATAELLDRIRHDAGLG